VPLSWIGMLTMVGGGEGYVLLVRFRINFTRLTTWGAGPLSGLAEVDFSFPGACASVHSSPTNFIVDQSNSMSHSHLHGRTTCPDE
jgi:hypothetical protein